MRKFFYLFLLPLCFGLQACGGDDDPISGPNNSTLGNGDVGFEITAENLAKFVSANVSLDEDKKLWTAYINTSLAVQLPNKGIKYGMIVEMTTSLKSCRGYTRLQANYAYSGEENPCKGIYAKGSGSSYMVSAENLTYLGMKGYDGDNGKTVWVDEVYNDQTMIDYMLAIDMINDLEKRIKEGRADETDKMLYEQFLAFYNSTKNQRVAFTEELSQIWSNVARIFVEIDGTRYIVKEIEGDVRIPVYGDFEFSTYISGN